MCACARVRAVLCSVRAQLRRPSVRVCCCARIVGAIGDQLDFNKLVEARRGAEAAGDDARAQEVARIVKQMAATASWREQLQAAPSCASCRKLLPCGVYLIR